MCHDRSESEPTKNVVDLNEEYFIESLDENGFKSLQNDDNLLCGIQFALVIQEKGIDALLIIFY